MAGCFGNHPVDRWMEQQLFYHLNRMDEFYCDNCGYECCIDDVDYDEEEDEFYCPKCNTKKEL